MKPLGTSRVLCLSIVTAGILTLFYPFVTTDPLVAGTARWSPFDIVLQMYNGVLPAPICERCGDPLIRTVLALPLIITVEYILMVVVLLALCFRMRTRITSGIAMAGGWIAFRGWGVATRLEFEGTFFGLSRAGHVHYGGLVAAHLVVMVALFFASLELRDEESWRKAQSRNRVEPQGPQVVDAEVVQKNEDLDDSRRNPPRLHD